MNFKSITQRLWKRSPEENLKSVKSRFGLNLPHRNDESRNDMLDPLVATKVFPSIVGWCLGRLPETNVLLLGDAMTIAAWQLNNSLSFKNISVKNWTWSDPLPSDYSGRIVICLPPYTEVHWNIIFKANSLALPITTLGELVAPFLQISVLMNRLDYYIKSIDEVIPIFLGQKYFGPLKELDDVFSLGGKRVIEFGCFDGYQSLGLSHLNARLTCLDARADNVIKTRAALSAVGFNADIFMDDFHNAHANKYGRFDLAFAHGVYYHSVAPFVFLENLISLSDSIFIGGFCATDDLPSEPWQHLKYQTQTYRAKHYLETHGFTAGVNKHAWFFHKDDLKKFFSERGFRITVISDHPSTLTAGNFTRFLASKSAS